MNKQPHTNAKKHISIAKKELVTPNANLSNSNNCLRIALSKDISIHCIDNWYQSIDGMHSPKNFSAIDIDAQQVTSIDTAGIQLILALKNQADICEWQFNIRENSGAFIQVVKLLGMNNNDLTL